MTQTGRDGEGYQLECRFLSPLLEVRLRALDPAFKTTLPITLAYWLEIAVHLAETGATQLLVLDDLPGEVMTDAELGEFFRAVDGTGLDRARIAYVEGRSDQMVRIEEAELMALERGYRIRMFNNEADARIWLRYGEAAGG